MSKRVELDTKRAAIYCRVSTKWQVEDGDSLPMQREELAKYAQYALDIKDYEIFEDAGFSGKNTDRPDFQRMMARVRNGEFTHIVVWKLDRISRNLLDFAAMYAELKQLGVIFISKNEQFDTSTAIGEAMLKIILVFAELERNMTSERVSATMIARAQSGQWNGGKIPFGYSFDKASQAFSLREDEAQTVRVIYEQYEKKSSLLAVATWLNEHGYKTRSGIPWNPTTVRIILTSPFYVGSYRYNYRDESKKGGAKRPASEWTVIEDHHPAIVEVSRQDAIIQTLAENLRANNFHKSYERKNVHLFAGLLTCGKCGSMYVATSDRPRARTGWRPSIYLCARRRRFKDCDNKAVSEVTLGPFVLNFLANYIRAQRSFGRSTSPAILEKKLLRGEYFAGVRIDPDSLKQIHRLFRVTSFGDAPYLPQIDREGPSGVEEREILAGEVKRLERAKNRLKTLYLFSDDSMPEADYLSQDAELTEKIAKANQRLAEIEAAAAKDPEPVSDAAFMEQASYLVITEALLSKRYVDFEKIIQVIDRRTLKIFLISIVQNFCIFSGKISEIQFKNGLKVKFQYSDPVSQENEENPSEL